MKNKITKSLLSLSLTAGLLLGMAGNLMAAALRYSSYLGGSEADEGRAIAVDAEGFIYVAGVTASPDLEVTEGSAQPSFGELLLTEGDRMQWEGRPHSPGDAFVTKISPDGRSLVYCTYLGGEIYDAPAGIAVDAAGNAYVAGYTGSKRFPTTANALKQTLSGSEGEWGGDAFLVKLNPAGGLAYSTLWGGNGLDVALDIAVHQGKVYLTGTTASADFLHVNALQSMPEGSYYPAMFLSVFDLEANMKVLLSTTLGGRDSENRPTSIAVGADGKIYIAGYSDSEDLSSFIVPRTPHHGARDGFVMALHPMADGRTTSAAHLTYVGGSQSEIYGIQDIAVDEAGNVYGVGKTASSEFIVSARAFDKTNEGSETFAVKLGPDGNLDYSTYLGGRSGSVIAADARGNAYIAGNGELTVIQSDGSGVIYSKSMGGNKGVAAGGIAVDRNGNAYVTGATVSTDLQTQGAFQEAYATKTVSYSPTYSDEQFLGDAFVMKWSPTGLELYQMGLKQPKPVPGQLRRGTPRWMR